MPDGVARVVVEADTSLARGAIDRLRADAERAMRSLDREHASLTVDVNKRQFEKDIAEVEAELAALNREKVDIELNLSEDSDEIPKRLKEIRKEMKNLQATKKSMAAEKGIYENDAKSAKDLEKAEQLHEKRVALVEKAEAKERQEIERGIAARKRSEQAIQSEGRTHARAVADNMRRDELAAKAAAKHADEEVTNRAKAARASVAYAKKLGEVQRLEKQTGRPAGIFRTAGESRELRSAKADLEALAHEAERLGEDISHINPELERNQGAFSRWTTSLSKVRVGVGIFSGTVSQLGKVLVGLGPVVSGVAGALISVVGVLGAGIAGAGAVGAAGFAGFAASAAGVGLILHPMIKEFGEVKKLSESLAKAQLKYGENSEQAKTAQEQLNRALAGVSPQAKKAFQSYGQIGTQWRSLTAAARPAVMNAFGSSIQTVQALLPEFASESVKTTKVASHAWEGWMKGLRSSDAKQILGDVMQNFRQSIPDISQGLGSIFAMFGHISQSASKLLPSLSGGFADWAKSLENSVGQGPKLDGEIKNLVTDMQDLGHLTQDTGSFLTHFFGASSSSGDDLVKSLDHVITKWDEWATSASGKSSLKNFFGESVRETEQLFSALAPLTHLLFAMSRAFAPVTTGALKAIRVIGDMVQALTQIPGLKVGLEGVGAALAGVWAVGKVKAFAAAIKDVAGAVKGLSTAQEGGALASLFGGRGAKTVEQDAKRTEEAVIGVGSAATATEAEAVGLSAVLAPEVLIPAATIAAAVGLAVAFDEGATGFEKAEQTFEDTSKKMRQNTHEISRSTNEYTGDIQRQTSVNQKAKAARENLVKAVEKHGVESKQYAAAAKQVSAVENEQVKAAVAAGVQRTKTLKQAEDAVTIAKENIKAAREERDAAKTSGTASSGGKVGQIGQIKTQAERTKELTQANHAEAQAIREVRQAQAELNVASIPLERQKAHMHALDEQTISGLKQLQPLIGQAATKKIGNFVDPDAVGKITKLSNHLKSLGQGQTVKKIDVRSHGADETLGKLNRLNKQTNKVTVARVRIEGDDANANHALKRVSQFAQQLVGSKPVLHILGNASNATDAIQQLTAKARAAIHQNYTAEIKAADKTGPGFNTARQHLRDVANTKAEAKIKALNQTQAPLGAAKTGLQGVARGTYQAKITSVNQTAEGIAQAEAALNGIASRSIEIPIYGVYKGTKGTPPHAAVGGMLHPFAVGGRPDPAVIARAAVRAEKSAALPSQYGQKVTRPTMLTGEENGHPEYVIATNPAYRQSNERYLESAAEDLGKEVIPAYATGKGSKKASGSGSKGSSGAKDDTPSRPANAGEKPPGKWGKRPAKYFIRHDKYAPGAVATINQEESAMEILEHEYNKEKQGEEQQHEHNENFHYNYQWFASKLARKHDINQSIQKADTVVERDAEAAMDAAQAVFGPKGTRSPKALAGVEGEVEKAQNEYSEYSTSVDKQKGESSKEYNAKKKARAEHKKKLREDKVAVEKKLKKWKTEAKNAEKINKEAAQELAEVKHQKAELGISNEEVNAERGQNSYEEAQAPIEEHERAVEKEEETREAQKQQQEEAEQHAEEEEEAHRPSLEPAELALVEAENHGVRGSALKPYKEGILAAAEQRRAYAASTANPKDDLEAAQEVRSAQQALEEQAGNTAEEIISSQSMRQNLYSAFAGNLAGLGTVARTVGGMAAASLSPASAGFGPGFTTGTGNPGFYGAGSIGQSGPTTSNTIVNNFAAPPPDPHTWAAQQSFELGALA